MWIKKKYFVAALLFLLVGWSCKTASASFIDATQAHTVVENWLNLNPVPLSQGLGSKIRTIVPYRGTVYGNPGYYVVFLDPSGWVVVPADDRLEAIRAFGDEFLTPEMFDASPLKTLFKVNLPAESTVFTTAERRRAPAGAQASSKRWQALQQQAHDPLKVNIMALPSKPGAILSEIQDDIVVAPLLKSTWGQSYLRSSPFSEIDKDLDPVFYNAKLSWNNQYYLAGCTSVAISMLLRHMEFPDRVPAARSSNSRITIDGTPLDEEILRTDRAYDWNLMEKAPEHRLYAPALAGIEPIEEWEISPQKAEAVRDEIATLVHDVGVFLEAKYEVAFDTVEEKTWSGSEWVLTGRFVSRDISGTSAPLSYMPNILNNNFFL